GALSIGPKASGSSCVPIHRKEMPIKRTLILGLRAAAGARDPPASDVHVNQLKSPRAAESIGHSLLVLHCKISSRGSELRAEPALLQPELCKAELCPPSPAEPVTLQVTPTGAQGHWGTVLPPRVLQLPAEPPPRSQCSQALTGTSQRLLCGFAPGAHSGLHGCWPFPGSLLPQPSLQLQPKFPGSALFLRFFSTPEPISVIRQDNNKPHTTLILYGPPGCGMCKLSEQVQTAVGQDSDIPLAPISCLHIIISISTAEPDTLNNPQHAVPEAGHTLKLDPCPEGEEMLELPLASDREQINPAQRTHFHQSFPQGNGLSDMELLPRQFVEEVQDHYLSKQDKNRHFPLAGFCKGTWR
ncbi:LOW QUALITY PROTEIN: hypothetical protein Nmel_018110, partial [Mimus melanotis]